MKWNNAFTDPPPLGKEVLCCDREDNVFIASREESCNPWVCGEYCYGTESRTIPPEDICYWTPKPLPPEERRKAKLKLSPCPNCGSTNIVVNHILSRRLPWWYYCECDDCHWCGKTKLGVHRAARAWAKEEVG